MKLDVDDFIQSNNIEDIDEDLVLIRYYDNNNRSDILRRIRVHNEKTNNADSSISEISILQKKSEYSMFTDQSSDHEERSSARPKEPRLGIRRFHDTTHELCLGMKLSKQKRKTQSLVLKMISMIEDISLVYIQVVNILIDSQDNNLSKLAVYCYLWRKYVRSVIELDEIFTPLNNNMDDLMAHFHPDYPLFPSYSIWRLMVD